MTANSDVLFELVFAASNCSIDRAPLASASKNEFTGVGGR